VRDRRPPGTSTMQTNLTAGLSTRGTRLRMCWLRKGSRFISGWCRNRDAGHARPRPRCVIRNWHVTAGPFARRDDGFGVFKDVFLAP